MTQDEIIETNRRQMFASARGARIQIFVSETRIHPDDEHLQYGPISTALREMTFDATLCKFSWEWSLASSATCEFASGIDAATLATDYDLYYLFLAEFLADEGM